MIAVVIRDLKHFSSALVDFLCKDEMSVKSFLHSVDRYGVRVSCFSFIRPQLAADEYFLVLSGIAEGGIYNSFHTAEGIRQHAPTKGIHFEDGDVSTWTKYLLKET